ncbi:MAG: hypothetical protein ACREQR_05510 [Candidatus Binataceae bacterium]
MNRADRRFSLLRAAVLISMVSVGLSACAHITFQSVDAWNKPWYTRWFAQSDGIHYYRPKPYLLLTVTTTEKTGAPPASTTTSNACVAEIEYLPDYGQEYVMVPHYWLGSVAMKPTLTDGWNLTAFDSTVDTKIPDTITALAGLAKSIAPSGTVSAAASTGGLAPGLYPIVQKGDSLALGDYVFTAPGVACQSLVAAPPPAKATPTPSAGS